MVPLQGVLLPAIPWARPHPPTPRVSLEWIIWVIQLYLAMIQNLHIAHSALHHLDCCCIKDGEEKCECAVHSFITSQSQCLRPSWAFELFRREVAIENVGDSKTLSTYTTDDNFDRYPSICSMMFIQLWLVYGCIQTVINMTIIYFYVLCIWYDDALIFKMRSYNIICLYFLFIPHLCYNMNCIFFTLFCFY